MSIPTEPTSPTSSATVPAVPTATVTAVPTATVPVVPIAQLSLDQTIVEPGIIITNQQGETADGTGVTHTTFTTTDPTFDPQITQNLLETVDIKNASYDDTSSAVLAEIKTYASKISCSDFHGKGSIDDYTELFKAAANIANESKQMTLDVDVDGFTDFGKAADELSNLFNGYIIKLQNVSIISDLDFLKSILDSLKKIFNLSEVFGKFKQTILATSTIQIPKSAHETKLVLENVMDELTCAIDYMNYFVDPAQYGNNLSEAKLSVAELNAIDKAVSAIENWNTLAEQGVTIAMANNPDIQYVNQANIDIKNKTVLIKNVTSALKTKLSAFVINKPV
jgi:hypothetical protein